MYSSGILPFTFIDDEVYLLIGRESYDKSYSDFGGKCDKNDQSVLHTAYREFKEETMYEKLDLKFFENNQCQLYTESRTLKGNIYYMFLIHLDLHTINDIIHNFSRRYHRGAEKDHIRLIKLSDLLGQIIQFKTRFIKLRKVFETTMTLHFDLFKDINHFLDTPPIIPFQSQIIPFGQGSLHKDY